MKMKEITNKTPSDLDRLLTEKKEALRAFRFSSAGAKTKNVKEGRGVRKDIARIMTEMQKKKAA
jgi:ribosomal protein L29